MAECDCFVCRVVALVGEEISAYRLDPDKRNEPAGAATAHVMGKMWGVLDAMLKHAYTPAQQIEFAEAYAEEFVKIVKARLADSAPAPTETRH
ncbi:hypothetical protein [Oceanibaculum indicum]|uniref:Uncharacterized protein n=1 Tax=Oceanibaculum indicum P24 TaxID=1207063 RepID=K2JV61_9PROT|nr:hypothetical protein [Oceanibaculum indicum]EKE78452.1 hypothetical protein P24_02791 [Oceanibaculum indicum P24]